MPTLTIRRLPDEVHRALKLRAVQTGRSTEAEIRSILESAVAPTSNIADALVSIGRRFKGIDLDFERDKRAFKAGDLR